MKLQDVKLKLIAETEPCYNESKVDDFSNLMDKYNLFSGLIARNCVTTKDFDTILQESAEKSLKRAENVKVSGHHSVFDHEFLTFEIQGLSKAFAMVLNNEKFYNTTEKSMRYTVNYDSMTAEEKQLYCKWQGILENLIALKYKDKYPAFFTDEKIKKLAQENARYLLSVYSPTSMIYTASVRNLNYMHNFIGKELQKIDDGKSNVFYSQLKPSFEQFNERLEDFGIIDKHLEEDNKGRGLTLYNDYKPQEYFGDVYSANYVASLAYLAQAQRHRTINYSFAMPKQDFYYFPPILKENNVLLKEWIKDCHIAQEFVSDDINKNILQSNLVCINEQGTMDSFILKMKERKCTYAQLEINRQTNEILNRYISNLKVTGHPRAEELETYNKGARCTFSDYKCTNRCNFIEGITETRQI